MLVASKQRHLLVIPNTLRLWNPQHVDQTIGKGRFSFRGSDVSFFKGTTEFLDRENHTMMTAALCAQLIRQLEMLHKDCDPKRIAVSVYHQLIRTSAAESIMIDREVSKYQALSRILSRIISGRIVAKSIELDLCSNDCICSQEIEALPQVKSGQTFPLKENDLTLKELSLSLRFTTHEMLGISQ